MIRGDIARGGSAAAGWRLAVVDLPLEIGELLLQPIDLLREGLNIVLRPRRRRVPSLDGSLAGVGGGGGVWKARASGRPLIANLAGFFGRFGAGDSRKLRWRRQFCLIERMFKGFVSLHYFSTSYFML